MTQQQENNLPSEWLSMPLGDAVQINPRVPLERGLPYSHISMADVEPNRRDVVPGERRIFKGSGARFEIGDTLMARITPCLENGKIVRFNGYEGENVGWGSTEFIVIRGRDQITDSGFAYYMTLSDKLRQYAVSSMMGTSGRQRVPVNALSEFKVSLPPLPEQRRIAHILGTLDDKIELNRRMNETLDEMARAIFKDWFVDFGPVRAKMEGRAPYLPDDIWKLFPDSLVDSELGQIPNGWEVKALDEIANFRNGLALQKFRPKENEDRLPVVKIAQLRSGYTKDGPWASANITPECVIDDGDVIFAWSGSLMVKVWCGGQGALNQHLFKVTSAEYPKWLCFHYTNHHLPEFQRIAADKTTTMGHIKRHHLSDAKCAVPSRDLLSATDEILDNLLVRSIAASVESRTLAAMRDTLLPKLVSGEVRVNT